MPYWWHQLFYYCKSTFSVHVACIFAYNMTIILLIMLALCLMLSGTYYAQNYASIIGWCLLSWYQSICIRPMVLATLITIVTGYNAVVHLVFKELHNPFGKLVILYSLSVVSQCAVIAVIIACTMHECCPYE